MGLHPWLLLAPWYDWPKVGSPTFGTAPQSVPSFQKFTTSEFVDRLIRDPQASFEFDRTDRSSNGGAEGRIKLFQPSHTRLYVVVCELVCATEGLPAPSGNEVCQAGFVVRRHRGPSVPQGSTRQRWLVGASRWADVGVDGDESEPGPDADPDSFEQVLPLYPLAADDRLDHDARGRTIYFGAVPTSSSVHDADGRPQLDSDSVYELRCFVRRHDVRCARRNDRRDCRGAVVWSRPTPAFVFASSFDPEGCSQHRVTIELPDVGDLHKLADGAARLPATAQFRAKSSLTVPEDGGIPPAGSGSEAGPENCFFAIPLITLVAKFVLSLFMSIVMFVFGAWWMLKLRFCLPQAELAGVAPLLGQLEGRGEVEWSNMLAGGPFALHPADDKATLDLLSNLMAAVDKPPRDPPPPGFPVPEPPPTLPDGRVDVGPWLRALKVVVESQALPQLVRRERVTRQQVGLA